MQDALPAEVPHDCSDTTDTVFRGVPCANCLQSPPPSMWISTVGAVLSSWIRYCVVDPSTVSLAFAISSHHRAFRCAGLALRHLQSIEVAYIVVAERTNDSDSSTSPSPGDQWQLITTGMGTCGYVIDLQVADNSIVGSGPGGHNFNSKQVGFCLVSGS